VKWTGRGIHWKNGTWERFLEVLGSTGSKQNTYVLDDLLNKDAQTQSSCGDGNSGDDTSKRDGGKGSDMFHRITEW